MTAHELAKILLSGPDLPVMYSYNYGDYWRTTVAEAVSSAREDEVVSSMYHGMFKVVEEDESDEVDAEQVILLR